MNDLRTTLTGFITAALALGATFGFNLDPKLTIAILAIGAAVGGYFQKDGSNAS